MKKAEVKISTLVYTIIISMGVLMMFGSLTLNFTKAYDRTDLPEFKSYEDIYGNISTTIEELEQSQNDADINDTEDIGFFKGISRGLKEGYNVLTDNLIVKAMKTISIPFKLIGSVVSSLNTSFSNSSFGIPTPIKVIILSLATLSIIFAIIRAFWSKII